LNVSAAGAEAAAADPDDVASVGDCATGRRAEGCGGWGGGRALLVAFV
jgi:hypothetical protein